MTKRQKALADWKLAMMAAAQIADDRGYRETARLIRKRKPTKDELAELLPPKLPAFIEINQNSDMILA